MTSSSPPQPTQHLDLQASLVLPGERVPDPNWDPLNTLTQVSPQLVTILQVDVPSAGFHVNTMSTFHKLCHAHQRCAGEITCKKLARLKRHLQVFRTNVWNNATISQAKLTIASGWFQLMGNTLTGMALALAPGSTMKPILVQLLPLRPFTLGFKYAEKT